VGFFGPLEGEEGTRLHRLGEGNKKAHWTHRFACQGTGKGEKGGSIRRTLKGGIRKKEALRGSLSKGAVTTSDTRLVHKTKKASGKERGSLKYIAGFLVGGEGEKVPRKWTTKK